MKLFKRIMMLSLIFAFFGIGTAVAQERIVVVTHGSNTDAF